MVLGRPFYEPKRQVVVVPFSGPASDFSSHLLENDPRWIYFDFQDAMPEKPGSSGGALAGKTFERWAMSRRPGGKSTRLSLLRRDRAPIAAQIHADRHQIWILDPSRTVITGIKPTPKPKPKAAPKKLVPAPWPTVHSTPRPSPRPTAQPTARPTVHPTPRPIPRPTVRPTVAPERLTPIMEVPPEPLPTPRPTPTARLRRPVPVITPIPAVAPTPAPIVRPTPRPKPAIKSTFSEVTFDPARQAVVLPFTGLTPSFTVLQASPTILYVDFPGARLSKAGTVVQSVERPVALARWMAGDSEEDGVVRVTLNLTGRGEVVVAHDPVRKQILLVPQVLGSVEKAPASAQDVVNTVFVRATFDRKLDALVVPYYGRTPLYAIEQISNQSVYINFLNAAVNPVGVQFDAVENHPLISFWLMAKRPDHNLVRVAMNLPFGGHVRVLDDQVNKRLLLVPQLGLAPSSPAGAESNDTPPPVPVGP
jgi:hypothetical protein